MQKRAEKGYWNGGSILGYDSVDKKLIINENESKIVREIFQLRAEGKGYKFIVNILNDKGIKTKTGKNFSIPAIKLIVNNYIYSGKMVWKKHQDWSTRRRAGKADPIIVEGIHDAIIDEGLWERVQKVNELQKNSFSSNRNFNGNFLLTGILKCPKCGAGTVMSKTKKRNSDDYYLYYMCQAYHNKGSSVCSANLIEKAQVEQQVLNVISLLVNENDIINALIDELNSDNNNANGIHIVNIKMFKKQLGKAYDKRKKLDNDYFEGNIESSTYNRLMNELQLEINKLKRNIRESEREIIKNDSIINKEEVIHVLTNFNKLFKIVNDEEKKLLIRSLIREV
ncbi:recombinase family protein [Bacillus pacificus]